MGTRRAAETLPAEFFTLPVERIARELLGKVLVSEVGGRRTAGRIVETEAYLWRDDPASHAYRLRRHRRNEALFDPPGTWYVYLSYGVHWCANLVCGPSGLGRAVLLRALEPVDGIATMRVRRRRRLDRELCSGPGKLCQALGITKTGLDRQVMRDANVYVCDAAVLSRREVRVTPRIGITKAADWPMRFVVRDSGWVSQ